MEINYKGWIPYEKAINDVESMFSKVDDLRKVIILKDNKPAYILLKYNEDVETPFPASETRAVNTPFPGFVGMPVYTLHEAMKIVLSETEDKILHASELADRVYERRLYIKKDGGKAQPTQIRARCDKYAVLFEAMPGNYIRLKKFL